MRKLLLGVVGATALALGSAAGAVVTVDSSTTVVSGPMTVADTTTIGFTEASLSSPTFMETVVFTNTLAGLYSITLTTSSPDVDFTSAFLAGLGGPYNLVEINGNNSGAGSLGGSITIRQANAVPEPATWAMMLVGFGAVGFAMRRRQKPV